MANYPQYNYPPMYPQQMQPMYQQPVQQVQQEPQPYCRMVASIDEARGVPVDFSGKPMIFPHLAAGRIYVKAFDTGSGSAVFREFRLYDAPQEETPVQAYAPMSAVQQLQDTVAKLEEELKAIKATKRSRIQEVVQDEH